MCIHTQNLNSYKWCLSVYHKSINISVSIFFSCQNRKLELSIDILFVWEIFSSDAIGVHKKYFSKLVQNPTLCAVLNNGYQSYYDDILKANTASETNLRINKVTTNITTEAVEIKETRNTLLKLREINTRVDKSSKLGNILCHTKIICDH